MAIYTILKASRMWMKLRYLWYLTLGFADYQIPLKQPMKRRILGHGLPWDSHVEPRKFPLVAWENLENPGNSALENTEMKWFCNVSIEHRANSEKCWSFLTSSMLPFVKLCQSAWWWSSHPDESAAEQRWQLQFFHLSWDLRRRWLPKNSPHVIKCL